MCGFFTETSQLFQFRGHFEEEHPAVVGTEFAVMYWRLLTVYGRTAGPHPLEPSVSATEHQDYPNITKFLTGALECPREEIQKANLF